MIQLNSHYETEDHRDSLWIHGFQRIEEESIDRVVGPDVERSGQIWDVLGGRVEATTDTLALEYDGERGVKKDP